MKDPFIEVTRKELGEPSLAEIAWAKGFRYRREGNVHAIHTFEGYPLRVSNREKPLFDFLAQFPDDPEGQNKLDDEEAEETAQRTDIGDWVVLARMTEEFVWLTAAEFEQLADFDDITDEQWADGRHREITVIRIHDGEEVTVAPPEREEIEWSAPSPVGDADTTS
jgi:hypothetical protein